MHQRRLAVLATVGVLAGSVAACATADGAAHRGQPGSDRLVLKVATTEPIGSLDPAGGRPASARSLQANLFQTLLTMVPGKPTPVPDAADCQYDAPTVYTCTLKKGLTFANKHELTSSDVKFSLDRLRRLEPPAQLFSSIGSVTTPDPLVVVFTLKRPDARLPYLLTTVATSIVDEQVYPAGELLVGRAVGSGPYQLTAYRTGERAVLAKFAAYRGARPARNDGVELSRLTSSADLRRAIETGRADVGLHGFGPTDLHRLRVDSSVQVVDAHAAEIRYFAFHLKSTTARQVAVRRAVAQLVDRAAIARRVYAGQVTPLYSLVPAGFGGRADAFQRAYGEPSRSAAAAVLREGGVTAPVALTVGWTPTRYGAGAQAEAQELKRQLDASGLFKVTLRGVEWPRYRQLSLAGAFDLYHSGWIPAFPDGDAYLAPFVREGGARQHGYRSQPAIRLLDREVAAQQQTDREEALAQAEAVIAQDVPVLPIWQARLSVAAGEKVRNVADTVNPLSYIYYSPLQK